MLYSVLPFPEAFNGYIVVHFLIAGLGMLLLARRCGLEPWAGLVAAEAFMLSGFTVSCAAQYPMIAGVAVPPLVVAVGLGASREPTPTRVASTAGLLALQILGGQPEPVLMSMAVGVLWSLADGSERAWYRRVEPWFAACSCAIALAAPQVLPAWLYLKGTIRNCGYLPSASLFWSLDPHRITWTILPGGGWNPLSRLSGGPSVSLIDGGVPLVDSIYLGLGTWVLSGVATVSAVARWRTGAAARAPAERIVIMAFATAALGVTAALGRHVVGVEWVLVRLPVALPMRYPVKTLMLTAGWRATVNGSETPIIPANGIFRAVEIPQGPSTVRFSNWPPGLLTGATLAGSVLAGLGAACLRSRRQRPGRFRG